MSDKSSNFKKEVSLFGLTMIAVGSSIGSGIFKTPSEIANFLPSEGLMLSVWVVGGLISLCGAFTFAEISAQYPKAGGFYIFLKEAFGNLPAFLYGWSMLLVINTGSLAALSLVFSSYLNSLIPISDSTQLIFSVLAIVLLTIMNVFGVKFGSIFANIFTLAKLTGILLVIFIGFWYVGEHLNLLNFEYKPQTEKVSLISAFGLALIGVTFSYGGYQHATFIAAEVKNAQKILPKAMLFGILIVCVSYLIINIAYLKLLPISNIASSTSVAADAINQVWVFGSKFISFLIVLSVLGTIGIYILTAPRIYFAMSDDKLFFSKFSEIHSKYKTPHWAIIFQSVWTIVLLIFWKTFSNLITFVVFVDALFFLLTAATIFIFRKRNKELPFKTIGYPVVPIVFIAIELFILINTLVNRPFEAIAGLIFLGLGTVFYYLYKFVNH